MQSYFYIAKEYRHLPLKYYDSKMKTAENAHQSFYQKSFVPDFLFFIFFVQPKQRTSSEESMAAEDDRTRKLTSLCAPTPLIRTSSGTHVRPTPQPRTTRHSGERQMCCSVSAQVTCSAN